MVIDADGPSQLKYTIRSQGPASGHWRRSPIDHLRRSARSMSRLASCFLRASRLS
jgi:hypothetical protein